MCKSKMFAFYFLFPCLRFCNRIRYNGDQEATTISSWTYTFFLIHNFVTIASYAIKVIIRLYAIKVITPQNHNISLSEEPSIENIQEITQIQNFTFTEDVQIFTQNQNITFTEDIQRFTQIHNILEEVAFFVIVLALPTSYLIGILGKCCSAQDFDSFSGISNCISN